MQIIGFNINLDHKDEEEDVSYYYTLHLSTMCAPFYTSEKLAKDNPMWSEVNFHYVHGSATGNVISFIFMFMLFIFAIILIYFLI